MLRILTQTIILQIALSLRWICSVEVGKDTHNNKKEGSNLGMDGIF